MRIRYLDTGLRLHPYFVPEPKEMPIMGHRIGPNDMLYEQDGSYNDPEEVRRMISERKRRIEDYGRLSWGT